jgi:hypothetical protein
MKEGCYQEQNSLMNSHRPTDRTWSEAGTGQLAGKLLILLPHNIQPTSILCLPRQDGTGKPHRIVRNQRWLKGHRYIANSRLKARQAEVTNLHHAYLPGV